MQAKIQWKGKVQFEGTSGTGHTVVMDGPEEKGGEGAGARPMELILLGLGGCTSFDVVSILTKSRQEVTDCVASIQAERSDKVPSVFTKIHIEFEVSGRDLKEAQVERAIKLSAEKYCSASLMLEAGGVDISHSYTIKQI